MLDIQALRTWRFDDAVHRYTERDTMLHALGIGLGADPVDPGQLRFVYERNLQALPTMAATIGAPGSLWSDPRIGADPARVVHGAEDLRLFRPLPTHGATRIASRISSVTDKGAGRGAIVVILRELTDAANGDLIARERNVQFLRGYGGFSACGVMTDPAPEALPAVPERSPDIEVSLASLPQAALLHRLSGDYNALHADPDVARAAGYPRPILHGLCTYGMAAHAAIRACCNYDASRLKRIAVRFTAPVYPGDRIRFELWRATGVTVHLRAHVDDRASVVLDNGIAEIG